MLITTFNSYSSFFKPILLKPNFIPSHRTPHVHRKSHGRKEFSLTAASISTMMKNNRVDFLQTTDYTEATCLQSFSVFYVLTIH